MALSVVE